MKERVTSTEISKSEIPDEKQKELESSDAFSATLLDLPDEISIPDDLRCELDRNEGIYLRFEYAKQTRRPLGPEYVRMTTLSTAKLLPVHISFGAKDAEVGPSVNLISESTDYCVAGLLVYLPELDMYGNHDPDHCVLTVFPDASLRDIMENPGGYVITQWHKPKANSFWQIVSTPYAYQQLKKSVNPPATPQASRQALDKEEPLSATKKPWWKIW